MAFSAIFFSSCKINPNLQGKGVDLVQGIWEEAPVLYQSELLQYTRRDFKFTCDSFYVTLNTYSKVNLYEDSCYNNGYWKEYAKGTYVAQNDTLFLTGTFTKANFKQKISGCYRNGQYIEAFVIKNHTSDSLYLESLQQHLPVTLALKEKLICTPKALY